MLIYQKSISAKKVVLNSPENPQEHLIRSANDIYTVDESCFLPNSPCKFKVLFEINSFDQKPIWHEYFWHKIQEVQPNEIIVDLDSAEYFFREVLSVILLTFLLTIVVWRIFSRHIEGIFSLKLKKEIEE